MNIEPMHGEMVDIIRGGAGRNPGNARDFVRTSETVSNEAKDMGV
jgi:hypothetical protein